MLRNIGRLSTGALLAQVIVVLSSPILLRLYAPDAFGAYLAMSVVTNVGSAIVTLRYELAIQATNSRRRATALVQISIASLGITTGLVCFAVFAWSSSISRFLHVQLLDYFYFIPIALLATGATEILRVALWRSARYWPSAISPVAVATTTVTVQSTLGFFDVGAHGIFVGAAFGQCAGLTVLALHAMEPTVLQSSPRQLVAALSTAKKFVAYPTITMPAGVIHMLGSMAPAAAVAALYGPGTAGLYYLANRLIAAPVNVLSAAVYPTFVGEAISLNRQRPFALLRLFAASFGCLIGCMAPALLLFPLGETLFGRLFGNAWSVAGTFAAWIAVGEAFRLAATSTSVLNALRHNRLHALWVSLNTLLIVASIIAASTLKLGPVAGVAVLAISASISYALLATINLIVLAAPREGFSGLPSRTSYRPG